MNKLTYDQDIVHYDFVKQCPVCQKTLCSYEFERFDIYHCSQECLDKSLSTIESMVTIRHCYCDTYGYGCDTYGYGCDISGSCAYSHCDRQILYIKFDKIIYRVTSNWSCKSKIQFMLDHFCPFMKENSVRLIMSVSDAEDELFMRTQALSIEVKNVGKTVNDIKHMLNDFLNLVRISNEKTE